jgi:hypothetical protein
MGSCTSKRGLPLCEATGSGVCKYIDCGSGKTTQTLGTYASPLSHVWQKCPAGSPGSPPASPLHAASGVGRSVYLMGHNGTASNHV